MILFSVKIRTSCVSLKNHRRRSSALDWGYVAEDEVGCDEWCGRPQFCKGTSASDPKKNTTENVGLMRVEIDKVEEIPVTQKKLMGILLLLLLLLLLWLLLLLLLLLMSLWHVFFFFFSFRNWMVTSIEAWHPMMSGSPTCRNLPWGHWDFLSGRSSYCWWKKPCTSW